MSSPKAKGGEQQDAAASARRVIALTDEDRISEYTMRAWEGHTVPGGLDSGLFRRLAEIDRAVSGISGIRAVLRADADCRDHADADDDVEYTPLNVSVVGRLEEALDALLDVADTGLEHLRLSDWSAAKGHVKHYPLNIKAGNCGGRDHG